MMSTRDFVIKAQKVHGSAYDYSGVVYTGGYVKIPIKCLSHGVFQQRPYSHLSGVGCPKCARGRITKSHLLTTEIFVQSAKRIFPQYDYSEVNYVKSKEPVILSCPTHGRFKRKPNEILNGLGCQECGWDRMRNHKRLSKESFIAKSRAVHGDEFDYSQAIYKNMSTKVAIVCPKHGVFHQIPKNHIRLKHKCPVCKRAKTSLWKRDVQDKVIEKFRKTHGDLYDYSRTVYSTSQLKVEIGCSKHGAFMQSPNAHIMGSGCPVCSASKAEKQIRAWLDEKGIEYEPQKTFKGCRNIRKLPFDFYIPSRGVCIEFDGELHYKMFRKAKTSREKLTRTKKNDAIKNDFCTSQGIHLLRIPYWKQKQIPLLLSDFFDSGIK